MNRLLPFFLVLLTVCGCGKFNNPDGPGSDKPGKGDFTTSVQELRFTASGGEQSFTVTSKDDSWEAGSNVRWMKCTTDGNTVTVSVEPNRDLEEREGAIFIGSGDNSLQVKVIQEAKGGSTSGTDPAGTVDGYNPYPESDFHVSANTLFMRDEVAGKILEADTKSMIFKLSKDAPAECVPQVGEHYIVNNRLDLYPDGVLMFIQEVTETSDGYEVRYTKDGLGSVFKDLHIDEQALDISSSIKKILDADGNEIKFTKTRATESESWTVTMPEVGLDLGAGFEFTPKMTVKNTLKFQLLMDEYRISTLNVVYDGDVTLGADLAIGLDGPSVGVTKKLFTIVCGVIPVGPIMITPNIDFFAIVSASGSISFEGSVSYQTGAVAKAHYDEINYLSGEVSKKDNDKFEYSVGPKVSGSFEYGLLIGPSVGIYGETVELGFGLSFMLQEEISHKKNIADPRTWDHTDEFSWGKALQEGEYANNFLLVGNVFMTGLGFPVTLDLKTIKFPIESVKLIPTISDFCIAEIEGRELTLSTWVKNKSLVYPELFLDLNDGELHPFDFDQGKINELENGADSVMITVNATVNDNLVHSLGVYCTYQDMNALLKIFNAGRFVDADEENAMKNILADIYACRAGEWKGCDWMDDKKGVANMKNITLFKGDGSVASYRILVPPEWKLSDNLIIGNYSASVKDFEWELDVEGERKFSKVQIEDANCVYGFVGENCDTYIYHSTCERCGAVFPENAKVIDVAGTNIQNFRINPFLDGNVFRPKKVILDNCPKLESIAFGRSDDPTMMDAPEVSAKDCPKLANVTFSYTEVPGGFLDNIEMHGGRLILNHVTGLTDISIRKNCELLSISHCIFNSLNVTGLNGLKTFSLSDCTFAAAGLAELPCLETADFYRNTAESVTIDNCGALERVQVSNYDGTGCALASLSVTNCASLNTLYCQDVGMSSFEASGLPVIEYLNCSGNRNLTGVMLPVFDQMYNAGLHPVYDIRFEYEWEELKKDNGFGYYYPGEPDRGYHHYD